MASRRSVLLRSILLVVVLLAPLAITATERSPVRRLLLAVRDVIFTRQASATEQMAIYDSLGAFDMTSVRFSRDSLREARDFLGEPAWTISAKPATVEQTLAPIMALLPTSGGVGCGTIRRLHRKVSAIRAGSRYGCCSDFVEVFQLVATANGLRTREVQNVEHAFAEFWFAAEARWIMIDPQEGMLVADADGCLLSSREFGTRVLKGLPLLYRRLRIAQPDPNFGRFIEHNYGKSRWSYLRITDGADVLSQDRADEALALLPQSVAQLTTFLLGRRPGYIELSSEIFDADASGK